MEWNSQCIFGGKNIPENIITQFLEEIGQKDQNLAINFEEFKKIILDE